MLASIDESVMEDVKKRLKSLLVIKKVVEDDFGGKCTIDWQKETVNVTVSPDRELECGEAVERALINGKYASLYQDLGDDIIDPDDLDTTLH